MLAHLVFWDDSYVRTVSTIARGDQPQVYTGTARALDALAVQQNAGEPTNRLIERLLASQTDLEGLQVTIEPFPAQSLITAGTRPRTVAILNADVERHIRNHVALLWLQLHLQPQQLV